jgi:hypothetical protein
LVGVGRKVDDLFLVIESKSWEKHTILSAKKVDDFFLVIESKRLGKRDIYKWGATMHGRF